MALLCPKKYACGLLVFLLFMPWTLTALWGYVQMSCHPELNQYIQDTLHCVKPLLEKVRGPLALRDIPHPVFPPCFWADSVGSAHVFQQPEASV